MYLAVSTVENRKIDITATGRVFGHTKGVDKIVEEEAEVTTLKSEEQTDVN